MQYCSTSESKPLLPEKHKPLGETGYETDCGTDCGRLPYGVRDRLRGQGQDGQRAVRKGARFGHREPGQCGAEYSAV